MAEEIKFNDIERLKSKISDQFGPWSEEVEISQDMINRFADVTGDHQWIHIDVERAKRESPFGGPVAHGFLTLSLLPRLATSPGFQVTGAKAFINYGANKLRFVAPVLAGSKVHAHSRLRAVDAKGTGVQVTTETTVHVVGNDKPALIYEGLLLYVG
ncbi:MAG TPA: MaoC family dehydratase [Candidatus Binataceae bacterium]|nr:MaoC family dehydratase [Candidatus Binataceae bacterium]